MGKPGIDLRGRIAEALGNVGPDAPLRQIVESPQVQMALAKFEAADRAAGAAQRRFRSWGRRGIAATTFGVLVGALLLFPIDELVAGMPRIAIGALQTLALLTSVMATLVLSWRRPLEEWRSDRGKAERLRAHVLERILGAAPPAGADVAQLVAGKRKVLEHAYIADQLEYLVARSEQHRRLAGKVTPLRLLSYAIIAAASSPSCAASVLSVRRCTRRLRGCRSRMRADGSSARRRSPRGSSPTLPRGRSSTRTSARRRSTRRRRPGCSRSRVLPAPAAGWARMPRRS
mgnify:CR=1 FL=1